MSRSVPIPNLLFDELLPVLSDSELRLLLIVLRATIGWREPDGQGGSRPKQRDWLSHRQLVMRTGRSSAAISSAVQSLIDRGLIVVEDEHGAPLSTVQLRRTYFGRMYFRPGEMWITSQHRHTAKVGTTIDSSYNRHTTDSAALIADRRPSHSSFVRAGQVGRDRL